MDSRGRLPSLPTNFPKSAMHKILSHRLPVRASLLLCAAALAPDLSTARTVILANAPGTAPNGATNANVPATFGDNIAATITNIFEATAGDDGTVGTPDIDLTWSVTASPLGATNANAWQFHAWGGATLANTGGGVLQLDGSRTGSIFSVTFTPAINAAVKLNSFNFVGDTNGDVYQYRVRVVRVSDAQVVFTTDTVEWTTATAQNPSNTDPDTWAGAPKVDINYTGTQGVTYRLEIERLNDDSARPGSRVDIGIDNLDFDQLTTVQNDLVWTGALSPEWSTNVLASPKNWALSVGGAADFAAADLVTFDDSATGSTTVDITGADVTPGGLLFDNETASYTLTGTHGIVGNVELIKNSAGSLTLSNPNLHSARTAVNGGALIIDHPSALQNSTLEGVFGSATHGFGTITAATLGGLAGNADLLLENSSNAPLALTVGANNAATVHSGEISGSGSLTKTGTGRLSLAFDNTFTGGVTAEVGILQARTASAFSGGTVASTGGIIEFGIASSSETVIPNPFELPTTGAGNLRMFGVFGAGGIAPTPGTTVRLTGKISGGVATRSFFFSDTGLTGEHDNVLIFDNATNDFTGTVYLNRATIAFTSDAALGNPANDIVHFSENLLGKIRFDADNIVLNDQRAVDLPGAANNRPFDTQAFTGTIAGPVSGTGILVKQGGGTLILTSESSTFTGPVSVAEGSLRVDGVIPSSASAVTVASGATLGGSGTLQRPVTLSGGNLAPGSGVGTLQNVAALTVATGSAFQFDLADWTGAAGTGYDTVTADSLVITSTPAAPATVVVTPQTLANFTDTAATFTLVSTTGGITGFEDGAITVDASALPAATALSWSVQVQGNNLVLVYGAAVGTPFEQWAAAKGLTGPDAEFDADPDFDGVSNGIEFVIGGEPNPANPGSNSVALLPTMTTDSGTGELVFVFRRADEAAGLNPAVEYDTDLAGTWTPAQGGVNGVTINETENGFAAGIDRVEVRIPSSQAAGGRLFARLAVNE